MEVSNKSKSDHILTANAGIDQTVSEGDIVQFNGSVSYETYFPVWPVDISGDGQYMAIGWGRNVTFFSTASNTPLWTFDTGGRVGDLKLSDNGTFLIVGSYMSLFYFDTTSGGMLWSVVIGDSINRFDSDPGNRLDMTRDGKFVAAAAAGNRVLVYDTTNSTPTVPYWDYSFGDPVFVVRFSGDGRYIGMGGHDGGIYRLGWIPGKSINWTASVSGRYMSSSISYNADRICAGQGNNAGNIILYTRHSSVPVWRTYVRGRVFEQIISDDGKYFVSTCQYIDELDSWNGYGLWNTTLHNPMWTYPTGIGTDTHADALDMDRSANYVVGGSRNNNVYLFHQFADGSPDWSGSDRIPVFNYTTGGKIEYNGVSMSGDGTFFAAGSWDGNVYLFSTVGGPHLVWNFSTTYFFSEPTPYSYRWDLNNFVDSDADGNFENDVDATIPNPTYVYGDNGFYTIKLTVEDSHGCLDVDYVIITVKNAKPTIEPFGPITAVKDERFTIYGNVTDPGSDDLTFTWNWDDGTGDNVTIYYNNGSIPDPYPSPAINPMDISDIVNHTYSDYGVYEVTLTVEDDDGGISQYSTNVTVPGIFKVPPTIYINVSPDGRDIILNWEPPPNLDVDHYLIYRSISQIGFDFDSVWVNTSLDNETGESNPISLRTMWNDTNAAVPNDPNYVEQYYYIIRAVDAFGEVGTTSRTIGKWTITFQEGISTFSIPLEPLDILYTDNLTTSMNANYIKYMDSITHT